MEAKRLYIRTFFFLSLMALLTQCSTAKYRYQQMTGPTLYDRMGGIYGIAPIVDDLVERIANNDVINANPKVKEALKRVSKAGLKYQFISYIANAIGGPQNYIGRSLREVHQYLNIRENEWQAMRGEAKRALDAHSVPAREQEEFMSFLESVKGDIII